MATLSAESHYCQCPAPPGRRSLVCSPVQTRLQDVFNQVLDHFFFIPVTADFTNDFVILRQPDHCY